MAAELFEKKLENILFLTEDIKDCLHSDEKEDITGALDRLTRLLQRIDAEREKSMDLLKEKATLEKLRAWSKSSKEKLTPIKELRRKLKLDSLENLQREKKIQLEVNTQCKIRMIKEKEEESVLMQRQQLEEMWLKKTAELRQVRESISTPTTVKPQIIKLQNYTITPFNRDYKDWIRFWNQLSIEVDGSAISKISKFNKLLELVKGKHREDILGLPHTEDGYDEANKILNDVYGKDIKVAPGEKSLFFEKKIFNMHWLKTRYEQKAHRKHKFSKFK